MKLHIQGLGKMPINLLGIWLVVSCRVSVYFQFALVLTFPMQSDGQAELTRVVDYIPRWCEHSSNPQTVTHPSTNWAHCRAAALDQCATNMPNFRCAGMQ